MPNRLIMLVLLLGAICTWVNADRLSSDTHISFPIGVTQDNQPIPAWISREDLKINTTGKRILIIAGMDDYKSFSPELIEALKNYKKSGLSQEYSISAILNANPGGYPVPVFPPEGKAYSDKKTIVFYDFYI